MEPPGELVPLQERTPTTVVDGEVGEQATRAVLGVALLLGDGMRAVAERFVPATDQEKQDTEAPPSTVVVARRVGVGMLFDLQRRAGAAASATARTAGPLVGWIAATPLARPVTSRVGATLEHFYDAGHREEVQARQVATRATSESVQLAVPVLLDTVDLEPLLEDVLSRVDLERVLGQVLQQVELEPLLNQLLQQVDIDAILDALLAQVAIGAVIEKVLAQVDIGPIIGSVLDEVDLGPVIEKVLDEIDLPALVNDVIGEVELSSVVMDATGGITGDLVGGVRTRSASADELVERLTAKVLRRRSQLQAGNAPTPSAPAAPSAPAPPTPPTAPVEPTTEAR